MDGERERENYHIRAYFSSIQRKNVMSNRFVVDSSQITNLKWTTCRGLFVLFFTYMCWNVVFASGYEWVVVNVNMTSGKFEGKMIDYVLE